MSNSSFDNAVATIDEEDVAKAIRDLPKWEGKVAWLGEVSRNHYIYEHSKVLGRPFRTAQRVVWFVVVLLLVLSLFDYVLARQPTWREYAFVPWIAWAVALMWATWGYNQVEETAFTLRLSKHRGTKKALHEQEPEVSQPAFRPQATPEISGEVRQPTPSSASPFDVPPQND